MGKGLIGFYRGLKVLSCKGFIVFYRGSVENLESVCV